MERELSALFGSEVLQKCWEVPAGIKSGQARKVGKLAELLIVANEPAEQRALIEAMPLADRLLLCRWLADKEYAGNCLRIGK